MTARSKVRFADLRCFLLEAVQHMDSIGQLRRVNDAERTGGVPNPNLLRIPIKPATHNDLKAATGSDPMAPAGTVSKAPLGASLRRHATTRWFLQALSPIPQAIRGVGRAG